MYFIFDFNLFLLDFYLLLTYLFPGDQTFFFSDSDIYINEDGDDRADA